jgi:hypothetical protein
VYGHVKYVQSEYLKLLLPRFTLYGSDIFPWGKYAQILELGRNFFSSVKFFNLLGYRGLIFFFGGAGVSMP